MLNLQVKEAGDFQWSGINALLTDWAISESRASLETADIDSVLQDIQRSRFE